MNVMISDEIIKVLDALCERFGIVIDWTSQNVIPYVMELGSRIVRYEIITSILWLLPTIIPITIFTKIMFRISKEGFGKVCGEYDISFTGVMWVITLLLSFIGVFVIITQLMDIITCLTLPEKIIFNFLKSI